MIFKIFEMFLDNANFYYLPQIDFIRNHIPSDVKIHLIGHSIGSYISLKLLNIEDISNRIKHCYLLFPTIEYMVLVLYNSDRVKFLKKYSFGLQAETPNGKLFTSIVQRYFKIFYYLVKFLQLLPTVLLNILIMGYFWIRSISFEFLECARTFILPSVLSKIVHMASDEMEHVKQPDYTIIEKNKSRLTFFYSTTDNWTPITYYERLIQRFPDINALLTDKHDHAFVLKSSTSMGALVAEWIQQNSA